MVEQLVYIHQNFKLKINIQRLPVGLVPDAEPLDLLQADGACERL